MVPGTIAVLLLTCCCFFSTLYGVAARADQQVGNHPNDEDVKVQVFIDGIEDDPALSLAIAKLAKTAGASGYRIEPVFSSQTFSKATDGSICVTVILLQSLCRIQHMQL